jgi:hypothetical protein
VPSFPFRGGAFNFVGMQRLRTKRQRSAGGPDGAKSTTSAVARSFALPGSWIELNQSHRSNEAVIPRLSVTTPNASGPVSRIWAPLLPPSRMVLTSMVISKPSHSANAALQIFDDTPGTLISTAKLKAVNG